ncbi:MAG: ATPase [Lachnospiraceae bacterium]|nr:ATPase [Lachnospiraceae bacterium]
MIEKMKFLSITGPKEDIDRVVETYLTKYPMHLENALSELSSVRDLTPYLQVNPYRPWIAKADTYAAMLPEDAEPEGELPEVEDAIRILEDVEKAIREKEEEITQKKAELAEKDELRKQIAPYRMLPLSIPELLHFRFVKYRFGRIPRLYIKQFEQYVDENPDVIFIRCESEKQYMWGLCFVLEDHSERLDAVLSTLHFERIFLPDSYEGTAGEAYEGLQRECRHIEQDIAHMELFVKHIVQDREQEILRARARLLEMNRHFDVRKLAACTQEKHNKTYFILCGWMSAEDAEAFKTVIAEDSAISCIIEEPEGDVFSSPPTKLKNPAIVKPFELYVRMYGMPNYKELDPTIFVALTYALLFGAMFGDLGQGLCLLVGGYLLYRFKHMALAGIIASAGFFSSIFGVLYGSIFGFENVIPALWLRPKEAMTQIPVIGNLNTVFAVAIVFGMFLILSTMVMQIINATRLHEPGEKWFGTNGVAGLVFYGTLTITVLLFITGHSLPAGILLGIFLGVPVLALALKEPLTRLMEKQRPLLHEGAGMFVVETFFELFETMLSFFSNTLSFVRVGAFAVSHAAMMEVVLSLAGAENGGSINWIIVILGNIFVSGMEGLIVGIQVLRLEYYEMFGRFYKGDGKEFRPFGIE